MPFTLSDMLCCHSRFLDQGSEATGLPERMSCCDLSVSPWGLARRGRFRLRCTQRLMSPQIVWDSELSCCRVFEMHNVCFCAGRPRIIRQRNCCAPFYYASSAMRFGPPRSRGTLGTPSARLVSGTVRSAVWDVGRVSAKCGWDLVRNFFSAARLLAWGHWDLRRARSTAQVGRRVAWAVTVREARPCCWPLPFWSPWGFHGVGKPPAALLRDSRCCSVGVPALRERQCACVPCRIGVRAGRPLCWSLHDAVHGSGGKAAERARRAVLCTAVHVGVSEPLGAVQFARRAIFLVPLQDLAVYGDFLSLRCAWSARLAGIAARAVV
mmetsp:Transcript_23219/g.49716  ORF Transcript_23219/g.49716 Transcript_23219/m.49716 type:complete len:324 (-) Transcript_23219:360-1331(-)